ncbi:hypothetical protein [Salinicola aestuarinus]|uniref:hypothetical protein n=1 Tax=Salinicola aestuarinus TaxID=1949082 RepID=UPI000DA140BD|nr:hypothetical protein [Salinicola aestuarinus]
MANDGTVDQQQLQETINEAYQTVSQMVSKILSAAQVADDRTLGDLSLYSTIEAAINAGQLGSPAAVRDGIGFSNATLSEIVKFGLGNKGAQPTWPKNSMDDDPTDISAGGYRATSNIAGRPGGVSGTLYISGYNSGVANLLYLENDDDDPRAWNRSFVNGDWSEWKLFSPPKVYKNANGWILRFPNRIQVCISFLLTLTFDNSNRLGTDWTLPAEFEKCFVVLPAADWGAIASSARMYRATLRGDTSQAGSGTRIAAWSGYGETFETDDTYPDCRAVAIGVY